MFFIDFLINITPVWNITPVRNIQHFPLSDSNLLLLHWITYEWYYISLGHNILASVYRSYKLVLKPCTIMGMVAVIFY